MVSRHAPNVVTPTTRATTTLALAATISSTPHTPAHAVPQDIRQALQVLVAHLLLRLMVISPKLLPRPDLRRAVIQQLKFVDVAYHATSTVNGAADAV